MRRVTLDANVLAPGFAGRGSASSRLIDLWRAGAFELVLSDHLLQELERALDDPYFAVRVGPEATGQILSLLAASATLTELTVSVEGIATHPEDDAVIATPVAWNAIRKRKLLPIPRTTR